MAAVKVPVSLFPHVSPGRLARAGVSQNCTSEYQLHEKFPSSARIWRLWCHGRRVRKAAVVMALLGILLYAFRLRPWATRGTAVSVTYNCSNDNFGQVMAALDFSDGVLSKALLNSVHAASNVTYEDESQFVEAATKDIFYYSAFATKLDSGSCVIDLVSLAPTEAEEFKAKIKNTVCYVDNGSSTFTSPASFRTIREHRFRKSATIFITCVYNCSVERQPLRVALGTANLEISLQWVNVYSGKNAPSTTLSACVGPIYSGYKKLSLMANFFSYYTAMGVDHYHVYLEEPLSEVRTLLLELQLQGNVSMSIHKWDLDTDATPIHGQMAAIQDCIYRSKIHSKYVMNVDLDEFIFPVHEETLVQAVLRLANSTGEDQLGSLVVPNWMFCYEYPADGILLGRVPLLLSHSLRFRERMPWAYKTRSKYIASTSAATIGGVHFVWEHASGRREVFVPSTELAMNHYRTCCGLENLDVKPTLVLKHSDIVRDDGMRRFEERVLRSPAIVALVKLINKKESGETRPVRV